MPAFLFKGKKKKKKETENGVEKLFIYNEQNQSWQTEDVEHFTLQSPSTRKAESIQQT